MIIKPYKCLLLFLLFSGESVNVIGLVMHAWSTQTGHHWLKIANGANLLPNTILTYLKLRTHFGEIKISFLQLMHSQCLTIGHFLAKKIERYHEHSKPGWYQTFIIKFIGIRMRISWFLFPDNTFEKRTRHNVGHLVQASVYEDFVAESRHRWQE